MPRGPRHKPGVRAEPCWYTATMSATMSGHFKINPGRKAI